MKDRGLEWSPEYGFTGLPSVTKNQKDLILCSLDSDFFTLIRNLIKIPAVVTCMKKLILEDLQVACTELASVKKPSLLRSSRKVPNLVSGQLPQECIEEMDKR